MILEALNAPLSPELRQQFTNPAVEDVTGSKHHWHASLTHSVGCKCSERHKRIYEAVISKSGQAAADAEGISRARVYQIVHHVERCKLQSWKTSPSIDEPTAARYLYEVLGVFGARNMTISVTIEKRCVLNGKLIAETNRVKGKFHALAVRLDDETDEAMNKALKHLEQWRANLEAELNVEPEDWREPRDEHGYRKPE